MERTKREEFTEEKEDGQDSLLAAVGVEAPDDRHGENEDHEVRDDVQSRVCNVKGFSVDTVIRRYTQSPRWFFSATFATMTSNNLTMSIL